MTKWTVISKEVEIGTYAEFDDAYGRAKEENEWMREDGTYEENTTEIVKFDEDSETVEGLWTVDANGLLEYNWI